MAGTRLATTRTGDFSPLGTAGQRSYELIRREAAALGPGHEALFAEPSLSPGGDEVDWYATAPGRAQALNAAEPIRQEQGKARLQALVQDILSLADRLRQSPDAERRRLADALQNAVEVPDESCVYLVGDQPVIVAWAHHRNTSAPPTGVLAALTPRHASEPPPTEPTLAEVAAAAPTEPSAPRVEPLLHNVPPVVIIERVADWGWLWWALWLAVGTMALAIGWLLVPACGVTGFLSLNHCPQEARADETESERNAALESELYHLQRELDRLDQGCLPPPPPAPSRAETPAEPSQAIAPPPPSEFEKRVQDQGGETDGKLRITLIWNTLSDLDLHLVCPSGEEIYYRRPAACGGLLDIDRNAQTLLAINRPVENIIFAAAPASGHYRVEVHNFQSRTLGRNEFQLQILKNGQASVQTGGLQGTNDRAFFEFNYP